MRNTQSKTIRNISFAVLTVLLVLVTVVVFMTYNADPASRHYSSFAVRHHVELMGALLLVAIVFGFVSSKLFYAEIQKEKQETRNILGIVLLFLNQEERAIINLLVQNKGYTNQAEVARLPNMSRVKAHRSLQKMQEKQLIELVPHGKIRKVHLKQNILEMLLEQK